MAKKPKPEPPPPSPMPGAKRRPERRRRHGGAWKVAYADFVTALMALFIVLWMMNATSKVKQSIAGYFHDPRGYTNKRGAGPANSGEGLVVHQANMGTVQQEIQEALRRMPDFPKIKDHVALSVTGEGLRIDLLETEQGLFFAEGGASPTPAGEHLLELLAAQIAGMPNEVVIEGHTDARPFRNVNAVSGYGNWELSADRANAARRLLIGHGVKTGQIAEMRGYADKKLLKPDQPDDSRNRRVSVVVKFQPEAN